MNRRVTVLATLAVAILVFAVGAIAYSRFATPEPPPAPVSEPSNLVRFNSPVVGPQNATVTIVEFFDPSCEACRAFYPIVKQIMARYPEQVRLVLRYAPLHEGSDQAVRILEAARKQDRLIPVLEAMLAGQPNWAAHGAPNLDIAWQIAGAAGLDLDRARADAEGEDVTAVLAQEIADLEALGVSQTPTFYVNGRELLDFGPQQLADLVAEEVEKAN
ncbi:MULTISPECIES: DsbA family protein [Devosia]|uniref:Thioredoxin domain-containing protein n=1 Tax=Devosia salina TaxID=2860336 RepID=A0ABX8WG01_9HYPH|nr:MULTISPECIES: thioredoxin domain-containing protein [Devosia]AVF05109.1 disulfide bond formation protein DsbA [Devosia sp. I507]QYO76584.1 thioredoxin domain-containing protein [Devosia salina]